MTRLGNGSGLHLDGAKVGEPGADPSDDFGVVDEDVARAHNALGVGNLGQTAVGEGDQGGVRGKGCGEAGNLAGGVPEGRHVDVVVEDGGAHDGVAKGLGGEKPAGRPCVEEGRRTEKLNKEGGTDAGVDFADTTLQKHHLFAREASPAEGHAGRSPGLGTFKGVAQQGHFGSHGSDDSDHPRSLAGVGLEIPAGLRYTMGRMRKIVGLAALAVVLSGCDLGNLGFYLYPQAAATGIVEERSDGPLAGLEVVGYLPAHKIASFEPSQAQHLTDLVYFTLAPRADATLRTTVLTDAHRDFLRRVRKDYGVRVLMGVTDHSASGALAAIVAQPALRARFAARLTQFLVSEGFDGADFDWEYPGPGARDAYASLLQEIRAQFGPRGLKLSVAVSPWKPLPVAAYTAVDRVHGMLYDDVGRHSTLEKTLDHVETMVDQGVDPSKLLLGVPFYGRGYTRSGPKWSTAVSYKTLSERYRLAPNQDTVSGFYFNGADTVRRKVQYAKQAGLSGVMIWEVGQDSNDENSLLGAITSARKDLARLN